MNNHLRNVVENDNII